MNGFQVRCGVRLPTDRPFVGVLTGAFLALLVAPYVDAGAIAPKPTESPAGLKSLHLARPSELTMPRWQADLPLERVVSGHSLGDAVYVEGPNGTLICVTKKAGAVRWNQSIRYPLDYPPAIHKNVLYVFAAGRILALNPANGRVFHRTKVRLGITQRPFIAGDVALIASSIESVHAVSLKTGRAVWTRRIDAVPLATAFQPPDQFYAQCDDGVLRAFITRSGTPSWSKIMRRPTSVPPAVSGTRLYVPGPDFYLHALAAHGGIEEWRVPVGGAVMRQPQVVRGRVFVVTHPDTLVVLRENDGSILWRCPGVQRLITTTSDRAYLLGSNGTILAADLKTGKLLAKAPLGRHRRVLAAPEEGAFFLLSDIGRMLAVEDRTLWEARKR